MNLHSLGEELGVQTTGQQALLQNALAVVDESFVEVRSISHNLMPNALIKRGLAQAVRDFLDKLPAAGRVKINLDVVGLDRNSQLSPTVENVLFRVIQELVQNILKHAQATEITLQIIRHAEELTVLVEDNGVGFDPARLGPDAGIGLKNIETRMAYLGGRADFDAAPGRGTTVTLEVPLAAAA
jgi:signal transduction histidine kinase